MFLYPAAITDWAGRRLPAWWLLSRSRQPEAVRRHEFAGGFEVRRMIAEWIDYYNEDRWHSAPAAARRRRRTETARQIL